MSHWDMDLDIPPALPYDPDSFLDLHDDDDHDDHDDDVMYLATVLSW